MKRMIALKKSVLLVLALSVLSYGCVSYQMVRFETIPDKADLYVNGIPQGTTPVTVKLLTDAAGTDFSHRRHSIVARMGGYEDEKLVLQSPSYFWNNTKPFPETITLKMRKIRSDAHSGEGRTTPEEPKQQADANAPPLKKYATGSAFIVSGEGHLLSNYHIVKGCREIRIPPTTMEVLAQDEQGDLVLLKITQRSATFATFREGRGVLAGESIVVVGYPLHGVLSSEPNITTGVVSALAGPDNDHRFIQITAPVQPGNSGGPLLDQSGNVVGVVVATLSTIKFARTTGTLPQNVNFAISVGTVRSFLDAHSVPYNTAQSNQKLDIPDVAARAKTFTLLIECWK